MKANAEKATRKEQKAIVQYGQNITNCADAMIKYNPKRSSPIEVEMAKSFLQKAEIALARLASGRISYAEYFEEIDKIKEASKAGMAAAQQQQHQNNLTMMQMQQQTANTNTIANAMMYHPPVTCTGYGNSVTCQ